MQPAVIEPRHRAFAEDVLEGLRRDQKTIPSQYFYDARGSDLFEEITGLAEYYPTRTEISILKANIPLFAEKLEAGTTLIEFGSGSSIKTEILLEVMDDLAAYIAIDVSPTALEDAKERLVKRHPNLSVITVTGSFFDKLALPSTVRGSQKLGFFPGSTIGNFAPAVARKLLAAFRETLAPSGRLIVGVDLQKEEQRLISAYDDAKGITADFNLNLLTRINRDLSGTFDLDEFEHRALYNSDEERIEMHLVSQRDQTVGVAGQSFSFEEGETIHTENSHKYTHKSFTDLATSAGWSIEQTWADPEQLFAVYVLTS